MKEPDTTRYPIIVFMRDQVPNSSADKVLVTIKENASPVAILENPTKRYNNPE